MRRGAMASRGARAAREHGCHHVGELRRRGVTERVHLAVHPPQAPVATPALDPVAVEPGRQQLRMGDPPVLARRDRSDRVDVGAHMTP
ncbi:MAG: hypothetical protein QOG94_2270 [Solirubrobacteraceae bacterium]|nr:hypothetical protein [Solirubrobacteraceae bacterium]